MTSVFALSDVLVTWSALSNNSCRY